jgi:hypothetical protein
MQVNDTNNIVVTYKLKAFIVKLGLWVRKRERKSLEMFSRLKHFMEENSVEKSDVGIVQCMTDRLVNLQSRFPKHFPGAISLKHKWITYQFHADLSQNYDFCLSLEENYIDNISDISSKVWFP